MNIVICKKQIHSNQMEKIVSNAMLCALRLGMAVDKCCVVLFHVHLLHHTEFFFSQFQSPEG